MIPPLLENDFVLLNRNVEDGACDVFGMKVGAMNTIIAPESKDGMAYGIYRWRTRKKWWTRVWKRIVLGFLVYHNQALRLLHSVNQLQVIKQDLVELGHVLDPYGGYYVRAARDDVCAFDELQFF